MTRYLVCFIFLFCSQIVFAAEKIRVRVARQVEAIELDGFGLNFGGLLPKRIGNLLPKKSNLKIHLRDKLWVVDDGSTELKANQSIVNVSGTMLQVDRNHYGDELLLVVQDNRFDVISIIDIEDYLLGVLPSEMPANWPIEALKAQAITARSYANSQFFESKDRHYELDNTTISQVFNLNNYHRLNIKQKERIELAVKSTTGIFLADKKNHAFRAFYHADCGGKTENSQNVWGRKSANEGSVDKFCELNRRSNWSYSLSQNELSRVLLRNQILRNSEVPATEAHLQAIEPESRSDSGRLNQIKLVFHHALRNEKIDVLISGENLRRVIGFNKIKSTRFEVKKYKNEFVFLGKGHGHGVGMCQTGAKFMALTGLSHEDILKKYYPNVIIQKTPLIVGQNSK